MPESHDHDHHPQPNFKFLDRYVEKSCQTYCCLCGAHLFMMLLFIILAYSVTGFIVMDNRVPLYNRREKFNKRADSVLSAKDIADYDFNTPLMQLPQSKAQPQHPEFFGLELIYEAKNGGDQCNGGDIWTTASLEEIYAFENLVNSKPDYEKYCVREYNSEALALEAATINGSTTAVQKLKDYLAIHTFPCKPYRSALVPCNPSPNCLSVDRYPPGLIDCNNKSEWKSSADCNPRVDGTFFAPRLKEYGDIAFSYNLSMPLLQFFSYTHYSFGGGIVTIPAIKSTFPFGLPLENFSSTNDRFDDQVKEVDKFLWDTYGSFLWNKKFSNINFFWSGVGMYGNYVLTQLTSTYVFIVCSFLGVWAYLSIMTKSCFKSTMGMGQILMSFFTAYFLYRVIFQIKFFGMFNILAIFIILGIGADDIFVYLDTFSQAGVGIDHDDDEKSKLKQQLSNGWRVASKAMLVTSLTTMISFITNASSAFPAVYTFGVFAAILVFVNYMSVILYYPAVVTVHETRYKDKECCGPIGSCVMRVVHSIFGEEPPSRGDKELGGIEKWFRDHFVPFITKRKLFIIIITLFTLGIVIYHAAQLEADPNQPQMFPDSNNYQAFSMKKGNYFVRGGGIYNVQVDMVFGINRQDPIDRTGSVSTNTTDVGTVNWDPNWLLYLNGVQNYTEQMKFIAQLTPCVISLCEKVDNPSTADKDKLWLGGSTYRSVCILRDFKDSVIKNYDESQWNKAISPGGVDIFSFLFDEWFDGPPLEEYKDFNFFEKKNDQIPVIRLFRNEIKLTGTIFANYKDGIAVANAWDEWFIGQLKSGSCKDAQNVQNAFIYSDAFTYFFLQERLTTEAYSGIMYSIIAAFCVLSLFTVNWVIGFYATATIMCIILCVMGFTVMNGWKLGVLESICFVMVPGMAVDFVAHLAESYVHSHRKKRVERVTDMLVHTGVSVVSGAFSTIIACIFLMFPTIQFFSKFGTFIMMTIVFSLYMSLFFFSSILCYIGPEDDFGSLKPLYEWCQEVCCGKKRQDDDKNQTHKEMNKIVKKAESDAELVQAKPETKANAETVNIITPTGDVEGGVET